METLLGIKKYFSNDDNKTELLNLILWFIIVRISIVGIYYILGELNIDYLSKLYDSEYYVRIAKYGYTNDIDFAFFPLIPIIIRFIGVPGIITINNIASFVNTFLLYYICNTYYNKDSAYYAAKLYIVSPIQIYTMVPYTDNLFITLTLLSVLMYSKKKYIGCGLILGLSIMCRSTGSALFFALFIYDIYKLLKVRYSSSNKRKDEYIREDICKFFKVYIPAAIIAMIYPVYCYIRTKNLFFWIKVQEHWLKEKTNIVTFIPKSIYNVFKYSHNHEITPVVIAAILTDFVIVILYIFELIRYKNKKDINFMIVIMMLLFVSTSIKGDYIPLTSYPRYLLVVYPLYIMMASHSKKTYYTYILQALQLWMCALFAHSAYFF